MSELLRVDFVAVYLGRALAQLCAVVGGRTAATVETTGQFLARLEDGYVSAAMVIVSPVLGFRP